MAKTSMAAIVCSLHGRTGKTLLARVIAEYTLMSEERPLIFDTNAVDCSLEACFPGRGIVIDMAHVRDQMKLFDTLAAPSPRTRVVDVAHAAFGKFFHVMRDTDFVLEARTNHVEPVIFYIPDRTPSSFVEGRVLRDRFADCAFVVVDNAFVGRPNDITRHGSAYQALAAHETRLEMPALPPSLGQVLESPTLPLGELVRLPVAHDPHDGGPHEAHAAIRGWLIKLFREIYRIGQEVELRAAIPPRPAGVAPREWWRSES